jgi:starch synthase
MTGPKVLFVASELAPLAKTGGLGDVTAALPPVLIRGGADVRIILPLYKTIRAQVGNQLRFLSWQMVRMGWRTLYCGLLRLDRDDLVYYFIDNEYYFNHDQLYLDYSFDIERFSFFQRAVLESLGEPIGFMPDLLHLHDWQTGMIPCLLDALYRPYGRYLDLKTVYTIHNLKYQGIHGRERIADLMDLPDRFMTDQGILKDGVANFMKAGIIFADCITTVSPTYAREILTETYGEGLQAVLGRQAHKLYGLLNGIDGSVWDPASDPLIAQTYDLGSWTAGKAVCKAALQAELGLAVLPDCPLVCLVSRLVDQKGLDLLLAILPELLDGCLQLAILGTGDPAYEQALLSAARANPEALAACISFDSALAHRFYAGADALMMPSLFEPCGLTQMIAMRYGTVPVVRETGGLKDTVQPYNQYTGSGNGFSFANSDPRELLYTTRYACDVYRHRRPAWQCLVESGLRGDYSWDRSAQGYLSLYREVQTGARG